MTTTRPTTARPTTTRRTRRSRARRTAPQLTAAGVVGLVAHVERLRAELDEYRQLMADPRRDERVVLELERLMREVDRYESLLAEAEVIDAATAASTGTVSVGSRVLVGFSDGSTEIVRLVHPAEAFLDEERVSVDSPIAKAVLGRTAGEEGVVRAPSGAQRVTVVAVGDVAIGEAG